MNINYTATTLKGLEEILAQELTDLGITVTNIGNRAVSFEGNKKQMYQANLHLRTALRILQPVYQFSGRTEQQLYRHIHNFDWTKYLKLDQTFAINTVVHSKLFRHSKYVALKSKDAIVDQYRKRYGKRPSIDVVQPDLRLHLHLQEDIFTISLDSSGDSLHRRGYRLERNKAPLSEVLAAGMIQLSGWKGETHFLDPMCGSGTIVIEAALLASNTPPGLLRPHFGFQSWQNYDPELWKECVEEGQAQIKDPQFPIFGSDINRPTVQIARNNVVRAKVDEWVRVSAKRFEERQPPSGEGIVIMNPPYGERLSLSEVNNFYKMIGDRLKHHYKGYKVWIISGNTDAMKRIGLRTSKRLWLKNGPLDCKFYCYELY